MISDYNSLKTTVANWLNRDDLTDKIPDFILMAEKAIFRQLRCPGNESHITYTAGIEQGQYNNRRFISLTKDFQEVKNITYGGRPLTRISDQEMLKRLSRSDAAGEPIYFARLNTRLHFYPPADENLDVDLWYYETQGPLSDTLTATRALEFAPDAYLYGSLIQAEGFLINDVRIPTWKAAYEEVMASISDQGNEAEYAGSTVEVSSVYHDGRY